MVTEIYCTLKDCVNSESFKCNSEGIEITNDEPTPFTIIAICKCYKVKKDK